ncbi:hypothetical protein TWF481_004376 [Arthrobotrys musiformis]|uniref:Uncharacterized protein n=1 Tax=Arthrobotrys musiformis TaxID=47236 RepID=A0AAV9WJC4_9PEZI
MCQSKYFHNCKETLNKWEKLVPGGLGDCQCNEEVDAIEIKACLASCILAGGSATRTTKEQPGQDDEALRESHTELKEAVRDYKDGKIRVTDLIKTLLGRLGR